MLQERNYRKSPKATDADKDMGRKWNQMDVKSLMKMNETVQIDNADKFKDMLVAFTAEACRVAKVIDSIGAGANMDPKHKETLDQAIALMKEIEAQLAALNQVYLDCKQHQFKPLRLKVRIFSVKCALKRVRHQVNAFIEGVYDESEH